MTESDEIDLGFVYMTVKNSNVLIKHYGKLATILRGAKAKMFIQKMDSLNFNEQQQWMARVTGDYKRGNERTSKGHIKNRS